MTNQSGPVKRLFNTTINLLLPPTCLLCGTSQADTAANPRLCLACASDLPGNTSACARCALPIPDTADVQLCGQCLRKAPPFTRTFCPYLYAPPLTGLINRYKDKGNHTAGKLLGDLLHQACADEVSHWAAPDTLVTGVPAHWYRHLKRGFNQAEQLANAVAGALRCQQISICQRTGNASIQHSLKRKDRLRNLRGNFTVNTTVKGYPVIVVDDVMTTGATFYEMARMLLKAGATQVDAVALARTPLSY